MGIKFRYNESTLSKNLDAWASHAGEVILKYAETRAQKIDDWQKNLPYHGDPWTEHTGNAKNRFRVSVSQPAENKLRITMAHGVKYGVFLELKNEKRFAVIPRMLQKFGPEVLEEMSTIMTKLSEKLVKMK